MIDAIVKLSGSLLVGGIGLVLSIFSLLLIVVLGNELLERFKDRYEHR